jgi:hypothetical protein
MRRLFRSLDSLLCRLMTGHEFHTVKCLMRKDGEGRDLPLEYVACRRCGVHEDGSGWDD